MENNLFNYYKLRGLYHRPQCNKQPLASLFNAPQSLKKNCTYVSSLGVLARLHEPGCDTNQHSTHTAVKHDNTCSTQCTMSMDLIHV